MPEKQSFPLSSNFNLTRQDYEGGEIKMTLKADYRPNIAVDFRNEDAFNDFLHDLYDLMKSEIMEDLNHKDGVIDVDIQED